MNTAGRGVVLAIIAVLLGAVILWQGYDDTSAASFGAGTDDSDTTDSGDTDTGDDDTSDDDAGDTADDTTDDAAGGDGDTPQPTVIVPDDGDSTGGDTTPVLHPPEEVRVLVANGTATAGAATATRDSLVASSGYNGLPPANSTNQPNVELTNVYYVDGYQLDAQNIATVLGASSANVLPMPASPPVVELEDAHVLVELGTDTVGSG